MKKIQRSLLSVFVIELFCEDYFRIVMTVDVCVYLNNWFTPAVENKITNTTCTFPTTFLSIVVSYVNTDLGSNAVIWLNLLDTILFGFIEFSYGFKNISVWRTDLFYRQISKKQFLGLGLKNVFFFIVVSHAQELDINLRIFITVTEQVK